jgi:MFS family permease
MNNNSGTPQNQGYAWYVVIVLMVIYTLSFIDRQIMAFLVGPIRADLQISDTAMGLLGGFAFAIFYTLLGLPMGWLADRKSRRGLIAVGVVFWSVMTALCSMARSFGTLFAARVGVGVGEATLTPAAFSLIADYFPRERLARALSVYSMGILIGSGLASIVGGAVVQAVRGMPALEVPVLGMMAPWRLTFLIVGIPGLVIALLLLTVREPVRRNLIRDPVGNPARLDLREVAAQLWQRGGTLLLIAFGLACQALCNYGVAFWAPPYFARIHGWEPGVTGLVLGGATIIGGCAGLLVGGTLCDRWIARALREAPVRICMIGVLCAGVSLLAAFWVHSAAVTAALLLPAFFFLGFPLGSGLAALQFIVPNQVRGVASALVMLILSIGGMGFGSLLPGLFNDYLFRDELALGRSLLLTFALASVLGVILFRASFASYRRHHEALERQIHATASRTGGG